MKKMPATMNISSRITEKLLKTSMRMRSVEVMPNTTASRASRPPGCRG